MTIFIVRKRIEMTLEKYWQRMVLTAEALGAVWDVTHDTQHEAGVNDPAVLRGREAIDAIHKLGTALEAQALELDPDAILWIGRASILRRSGKKRGFRMPEVGR